MIFQAKLFKCAAAGISMLAIGTGGAKARRMEQVKEDVVDYGKKTWSTQYGWVLDDKTVWEESLGRDLNFFSEESGTGMTGRQFKITNVKVGEDLNLVFSKIKTSTDNQLELFASVSVRKMTNNSLEVRYMAPDGTFSNLDGYYDGRATIKWSTKDSVESYTWTKVMQPEAPQLPEGETFWKYQEDDVVHWIKITRDADSFEAWDDHKAAWEEQIGSGNIELAETLGGERLKLWVTGENKAIQHEYTGKIVKPTKIEPTKISWTLNGPGNGVFLRRQQDWEQVKMDEFYEAYFSEYTGSGTEE